MKPGRLLLITLSNIGDALMTTPVLQAMHRLHPDAVIDIVADRRSALLFEHCPFRGEIILKDKKAGWRGLLALVRQLRRHRYRLVVDLRTDGVSWLLRADQRRTRQHARGHRGHAVERAWAVISPLLPSAIPETCVWLSEAQRKQAAERLAVLPAGPWLAVAPGANWAGKIWPADRFRALIEKLAAHVGAIILVGGPGDTEACAALAAACPVPVLDVSGQTTLLDAAALLAKADLFIGNDSGLGHLCAAVGTPTLTLFGPGDPARYHPWGRHAHWLVADDRNIASLPVEAVSERAIELLGHRGST